MQLSIGEWDASFTPDLLLEMADLWNANAWEHHAFFPWTGKRLAELLIEKGKPVGRLLVARVEDKLAGFCHVAVVDENGYPRAGVVEALLVDRECRGRGIGTALLRGAITMLNSRRSRPQLVDALGAWPFGYTYNTLADGSERSGVFLRDKELYRLFRRAGFEPIRKSFVMRAETGNVRGVPRSLPNGARFHIAPRRESTWLDRVFRGRQLWDHHLVTANGSVMSRSIFGLMEEESRQEKKVIFSLFGVNTPHELQGRGYAGINLSHILAHVAELGGDMAELHVYADNTPALALYRGLGFVTLAETVMMHLRLRQ